MKEKHLVEFFVSMLTKAFVLKDKRFLDKENNVVLLKLAQVMAESLLWLDMGAVINHKNDK